MLFKIVQLFVGFFVVIEGEDGNIPIHHLILHGAYRHGVGNGVVYLPVVGKPAVKNVRLYFLCATGTYAVPRWPSLL